MNNELFFGNGLAGLLNPAPSMANTDDQKFIDINIDSDENDESTTSSSDPPDQEKNNNNNNKSFQLFNFKSSSHSPTMASGSSGSGHAVAKKLSQPEKSPAADHAPLHGSLSSPMSNKMKLFHLNKAADLLLSNLNEMNLKGAYDDEDDDEDEETEDDEDLDLKATGTATASGPSSNGSPVTSSDLIRRRLMTNGPLKYNSSSSNLQARQASDVNNNNNKILDPSGSLQAFDSSKRNSLHCDRPQHQHSTPLVSENDFSLLGAESLMNMSTSTRISNMSTLSSPNAATGTADFNESLSSTMAEIGDGLNELNSSTMSAKINSSAAVFYKAYKNFGSPKSVRVNRQDSIVDVLLGDIYDRFNITHHSNKESANLTADSEVFHSEFSASSSRLSGSDVDAKHARTSLENLSLVDLKELVNQLNSKVNQMSTKLIRQLKYKDKLASKVTRNCEIITAFLQARSQKRRVDTQMKFTLNPMPGEAGFVQWRDAMKALARLPGGVPKEFRKSIWLNLAQNYITEINLDWTKVKRIAFNDRSNPDDDELGIQIVKDLHRTGCSAFSGQENEQDRALLKRVLLAFARYNKSIGYCQGFNIIAALILEIVDKNEEDAFACMIYLIDHVMPEGYFTNTMHLLAIDMAVFREIMKTKLPKLCDHLNALQYNIMGPGTGSGGGRAPPPPPTHPSKLGKQSGAVGASSASSAACTYEPPLTNVFTMQWFLTLFATCLPKTALLRVWDCIFLEGAEILFRTSIAIWEKLSVSIMKTNSADAFYSIMSVLTVRLFDPNVIDDNELITKIYSYGPFPLPGLAELREKFTFNITPFQMCLQSNEPSGGGGDKKAPSKASSTNPFDIGLSHLKKSDKKLSSSNSSLSSSVSSSLSPKSGRKPPVSLIDDDNLDETLVSAPRSKAAAAKAGGGGDDDDLDLNNLRKVTDSHNEDLQLDKFNDDDDEVEDLAKMISCFALLMPARSSSSGQRSHPRDDIMMAAAAAAANAYSQKGGARGLKLASAAAAAVKGGSASSSSSSKAAIEQSAGRTALPKKNDGGGNSNSNSKHDISMVTPGAFSYITQMYSPKPLEDQLTLDLNELKKQYQKVKERQQQAHIIIRTASAQHRMKLASPSNNSNQSPPSASASATAAGSIGHGGQNEPPSPNHSKDKIPKIGNLKETTYSPYTLESPFPVVNHLLIKPSDPQGRNTVKTSVHIKSGDAMSMLSDRTMATPIKASASRMSSVRASVSCNESIASVSVAKEPVKKKTSKPYYSDDDEDDDDEDEVALDDTFFSPSVSKASSSVLINTVVNSPTTSDKSSLNFMDLATTTDEYDVRATRPSESKSATNTQAAKMDLLNLNDQISSSSSSSSSTLSLSSYNQQKDANNNNNNNYNNNNNQDKLNLQASSPDEDGLVSRLHKRRSNAERTDSDSSTNTTISTASKAATNKASVSRKSSSGTSTTSSKKVISTMIIENLANEERKQVPLHNPFKTKQLNSNVAKNGMRLGLYK